MIRHETDSRLSGDFRTPTTANAFQFKNSPSQHDCLRPVMDYRVMYATWESSGIVHLHICQFVSVHRASALRH